MIPEFVAPRHGNNDKTSFFPAKDLAFLFLVNFCQIWVAILLNGVLKKLIYLQRKRIPKNRRQAVERVAESEIVPNRHVFVSIFGQEIKEKVEK